VHLVETSRRLREVQGSTLAHADVPIRWHGSIAELPPGAAIIIANEFFDALPVQHFVRTDRGWCERLVGLDASGKLTFGLGAPAASESPLTAPEGGVSEIGAKAGEMVYALAKRIASEGGALLAVDYGYTETQPGETLQALRNHRFVDPLDAPGECDLTAHIDFAALARQAEDGGARVHGPTTQSSFLVALGIRLRAEILKRNSTPTQAQAIENALSRLTETTSPTAMGYLFKVMAITPRSVRAVPGFV
jgi:SAM-dependent MidA family methyltransferase